MPGLAGRSMDYPEGHILGGTSCLSKSFTAWSHESQSNALDLQDGLAYTRGSSDDYDRYAKITGDPGWSWNSLQPYFRKVRGIPPLTYHPTGVHTPQNERWTAPADNHNTTGEFDPAVHGYDGINYVSLPGYVTPFDYRVIKATSQLPDEFPFNLDINSGRQIGIGAHDYIGMFSSC
jgi:choline dehydrogenase-like flavoprotein